MTEDHERCPSPWTFEATAGTPDGCRVRVVIEIPAGVIWRDVEESGEIAQGAVGRALHQLTQLKERPPF